MMLSFGGCGQLEVGRLAGHCTRPPDFLGKSQRSVRRRRTFWLSMVESES